jgi:hypothetical protein
MQYTYSNREGGEFNQPERRLEGQHSKLSQKYKHD